MVRASNERFGKYRIVIDDSRHMNSVGNDSVDLIVTSPPYPMIEMWDKLLSSQDARIRNKLDSGETKDIQQAFRLMHEQLSDVLKECFRVLRDGGICCINIGDAVRSIGGRFQLFANHAFILEKLEELGFTNLPYILWKKPTNKPNAFLGSGFLPPNAYVTIDCEFILIARKGNPRQFNTNDPVRYKSKFLKEERDRWFSQIWSDVPGASQAKNNLQRRTGAFPIEIPTRLIRMFSIEGDTVLDPYMGTGTTLLAAKSNKRNFIGYEIDEEVISQEVLEILKK